MKKYLIFITILLIWGSSPAQEAYSGNSIPELLRQAREHKESDPALWAGKLKEARRLIIERGYQTDSLPGIHLALAGYYMRQNKLDSASYYIEQNLAVPSLTPRERTLTYFLSGKIFYRENKPLLATSEYRKALRYSRKTKDTLLLVKILINKAFAHELYTEKDSAVSLFEKAYELSQKIGYYTGQGRSSLMLGNIYYGIKDYDHALKYYKNSLLAAQKAGSDFGIGANYENIGLVFLEKHQLDKALTYIDSALTRYNKTGSLLAIANLYNDKAIIYSRKRQLDKAIWYLEKSRKISVHSGNKEYLSIYYNVAADVYNYMGKYRISNQYLDSCIRIAKDIKFKSMEQESYRKYYENLIALNRYKQALQYIERYNQIKDSTLTDNFQNNLAQFEIKFKTIEKEKELAHLKSIQLQQQSRNRLMLSIFIFILSMLSLLLLKIYNKRKKLELINRHNLEMSRKEKELIRSKLKQKEAEEKQLREKIESKNKQLTSHALNMMQKKELLLELTDYISKRARETDKNTRSELFEIRNRLQKSLNADEDWKQFQRYFEQVNESFFQKLKEINPDLTRNDFRLSALIKLNMSIKEIAALFNISTESAKNARYRLKKKLGLKPEQKLNRFINSL